MFLEIVLHFALKENLLAEYKCSVFNNIWSILGFPHGSDGKGKESASPTGARF